MPDELVDPRSKHRDEGFPAQEQEQPGLTEATEPVPDHGEESYVGRGRLIGRRALITGGDSGIGRAVAIAFAREGADVAVAHLPIEQGDAEHTASLIEAAGRRSLTLTGDLREESFASAIVDDTVAAFGGLDILVLNAAYQKDRDGLENLSTDEMDRVFRTNLYGLIFTARAALAHLRPGGSIIVTSSIQAFNPSPGTDRLRDDQGRPGGVREGARRGARAEGDPGQRGRARTDLDSAHPGHGMVERTASPSSAQDTPLGRAGQPAELAGAYVYLASEDASYVSGAVLPVTGGKGL